MASQAFLRIGRPLRIRQSRNFHQAAPTGTKRPQHRTYVSDDTAGDHVLGSPDRNGSGVPNPD